jgi:class 3 adenylate cyclase
MGEMPVGTVTLLFTDIEGSTRLRQEDEASMRRAVARHDQLLRVVVAGHGGVVFSTMGDGLATAFQTASAAVACAIEAQGILQRQSWERVRSLRVRMGLPGEAELREGELFRDRGQPGGPAGRSGARRPDPMFLGNSRG